MASEDPVVIVGAGLMGAAAAWSLARRGRRVVVLEQFEAGHAFGSSHGSARIVRRAYGDATYTRLTGEAFELWREVEAQTGTTLLQLVGALDFGAERDVPTVAQHLASAGVAYEIMPAPEAGRRWPGMRFEGDVLFHAQAGTVDSDAAVTALLADSVRLGAEVRRQVVVTSIEAAGAGALVRCADGSTIPAECVVVAAGAWLEPLLGGTVALPPLRVHQQEIFHFPRVDVGAAPWPIAIHEYGRAMYHLPGGRDGGPAGDRKLGEHLGSPTRLGAVSDVARDRAVAYVRQWLPGLDPAPRTEATCLYTLTPSEDFLLDRVGPIVICSPCSGHGAKFTPLVGEYVGSLVTGSGRVVPGRFGLAAHAAARSTAVSL